MVGVGVDVDVNVNVGVDFDVIVVDAVTTRATARAKQITAAADNNDNHRLDEDRHFGGFGDWDRA